MHLFWHSFDLAVTRFSGRKAPEPSEADPVTREAYSAELISFGFWPGDPNTEDASFYSYTHPEPEGLREYRLHPGAAHWLERANGSLAILAYDAVRQSDEPRANLLGFLESAYRAGASAGGWNTAELTSSFCPSPDRIDELYLDC